MSPFLGDRRVKKIVKVVLCKMFVQGRLASGDMFLRYSLKGRVETAEIKIVDLVEKIVNLLLILCNFCIILVQVNHLFLYPVDLLY